MPAPAGADRAALGAVLAIALAVRLWNVGAHTYVVFPDETFQYLEPATRLVFGSGVVTWEFLEGIRSWLLPGVLAVLLRAGAVLTPDPAVAVLGIRVLLCLLSLAVPFAAWRLARQRAAWPIAAAAALVPALWYELVYFSPVILTEVIATHCALLGLALPGRPRAAGALYGLAMALRFQYAPAIALLAAWSWRHDRSALRAAGLTAVGMVAAAGALDWVTWGSPFQSVWLYLWRNLADHIAGAMGAEPWTYPLEYLWTAWGPLAPVLAGLLLLGARRAGGLAAAAGLVLVLHMLPAHKELRFFYFALAAAPVLIGLGVAELAAALPRLRVLAAFIVLLLCAAEAVSAWRHATPGDAWQRDASTLQATAFARRIPELCGLGTRERHIVRTGGYTYLRRDVPIYADVVAMALPEAGVDLPLTVEWRGRPVPQWPGDAIVDQASRYNVLIAPPGAGIGGYAQRACFGAGTKADPAECVFERPGGCAPPG